MNDLSMQPKHASRSIQQSLFHIADYCIRFTLRPVQVETRFGNLHEHHISILMNGEQKSTQMAVTALCFIHTSTYTNTDTPVRANQRNDGISLRRQQYFAVKVVVQLGSDDDLSFLGVDVVGRRYHHRSGLAQGERKRYRITGPFESAQRSSRLLAPIEAPVDQCERSKRRIEGNMSACNCDQRGKPRREHM